MELESEGPFVTVVSVEGGVTSPDKLVVVSSDLSKVNGVKKEKQADGKMKDNGKVKDQSDKSHVTVLSLKNKGGAQNNTCDVKMSGIPVPKTRKSKEKVVESKDKIEEKITIYRLPGERLGFGLRFDHEAVKPNDPVKHLYIQSCSENSPAGKVSTSWGYLIPGDEIVEIESVPVNSLSRMECIQMMKDSKVVITLTVSHENAENRCSQSLGKFAPPELTKKSDIYMKEQSAGKATAKKESSESDPPKVYELDDVMKFLKPPMDFADEVLTDVNAKCMKDIAMLNNEAHNGHHVSSNSFCESDDTASTRSTVVSRLSMTSVSAGLGSTLSIDKANSITDLTKIPEGKPLSINHHSGSATSKIESEEMRENAECNNNDFKSLTSSAGDVITSGYNDDRLKFKLETDSFSFENNSSSPAGEGGEHNYPSLGNPSGVKYCAGPTESFEDGSILPHDLQLCDGLEEQDDKHFKALLAEIDGTNDIIENDSPKTLSGGRENYSEKVLTDFENKNGPKSFGDVVSISSSVSQLVVKNCDDIKSQNLKDPQVIIQHIKSGVEGISIRNDNSTVGSSGHVVVVNGSEGAVKAQDIVQKVNNTVEDANKPVSKMERKIVGIMNSTRTLKEEKMENSNEIITPSRIPKIVPKKRKKTLRQDCSSSPLAQGESASFVIQAWDQRISSNVCGKRNAPLQDNKNGSYDCTGSWEGKIAGSVSASNTRRERKDETKESIAQSQLQEKDGDREKKEEPEELLEENKSLRKPEKKLIECHKDQEPVNSCIAAPEVVQNDKSYKVQELIESKAENRDTTSSSTCVNIVLQQDASEELTSELPATGNGSNVRHGGTISIAVFDGISTSTVSNCISTVDQSISSSALPNESLCSQLLSDSVIPAACEQDQGPITKSSTSCTEVDEEGSQNSSQDFSSVASCKVKVITGAEEKSRKMETNLLHGSYVPPTFSRLPPDGDEFPQNWSDETHKQDAFRKSSCSDSYYGSSSLLKGADVPPPLPKSEPPVEDTGYPKVSNSLSKVSLGRRRSVEDRKGKFENACDGGSLGIDVMARPTREEPSKKSVKDKIAMFSSRTSSSEDSSSEMVQPNSLTKGNSSTVNLASANASSSPSLSKRYGVNGVSALSKSSENLEISSLPLSAVPNNNGCSNVTMSTMDLSYPTKEILTGRKTSWDGTNNVLVANRNNSGLSNGIKASSGEDPPQISEDEDVTKRNTGVQTFKERSQSMIDVGKESEDQRQSYQSTLNSRPISMASYVRSDSVSSLHRPVNSATLPKPFPSASSLVEQRRKGLNKLRGLVIPDSNSSIEGNDGSKESYGSRTKKVADLPAIISKDISSIVCSKQNAEKSELKTQDFQSGHNQPDLKPRRDSDTSAKRLIDNPGELNYHSVCNGNNERRSENEHLWNSPATLPKYSPAFKRRSLTPYGGLQRTSTSSCEGSATKDATPEPKSLESVGSPKSDSSFEFTGSNNTSPHVAEMIAKSAMSLQPKIVSCHRLALGEEKATEDVCSKNLNHNAYNEAEKEGISIPYNNKMSKIKMKKACKKVDDSDNDSAVSSSRSSISHELSPRNSPTPDVTSSTPDFDSSNGCSEVDGKDEAWRVLKAQSVEAINRKNVLTSSKFSSGGTHRDDSSVSSSTGSKNKRSDDEEASYADIEADDTESSCSEIEMGKNSVRKLPSHIKDRRRSKGAYSEDEDENDGPPSQLHTTDLGDDIILPKLKETPLEAIFDMEVKMAYINEVCENLPTKGNGGFHGRYFCRRTSESTVIEKPATEIKRRMSCDSVNDRRSRNRSSSGNESDLSSNTSGSNPMGSLNEGFKSSTGSTDTVVRKNSTEGPNRRISRTQDLNADSNEDAKWTQLVRRYSNSGGTSSTSSLQSLDSKSEPEKPKIVTSASEVVERKIEKIIEKSSDGKKISKSIAIPRGRNNFSSLTEKWQQISKDTDNKHTSAKQQCNNAISNMSHQPTTNPVPVLRTDTFFSKVSSKSSDELSQKNTSANGALSSTTPKSQYNRRSDGIPSSSSTRFHSTKRSVSVNDIRKAFERGDDGSRTDSAESETRLNESRNESPNTEAPTRVPPSSYIKRDLSNLTLPSAHFRVSSFDSTTSEESSATTPAGLYGSSNNLLGSATRDPYGSITSLASSTSLISPQELQQLIDEANQSLEEAGTPSHEVAVVILHREFANGSLGITLAGGADYETKEITVHKVINGSIADRDGRVHRGDRILSINGKSTKGLTHREALTLLKTPRTEVVLVVSRGKGSTNGFKRIDETSVTLERAVEPLLNGSLAGLLENDDDAQYKWGCSKTISLSKDGAGLGFSLEGGKGSIHGDKPLTVKKIFIGGPAEKSGELKVGDLITNINSVSMATKSRTEAWNFMKKLSDGEVRITVRSPLIS